MTFELYFIFLFVFTVVFGIIGNYVYYKAVHVLDVSYSLLPSKQFKHLREYKELLEAKGEHPWYIFILKNFKAISYIYIVLWIPFFALLFLQ